MLRFLFVLAVIILFSERARSQECDSCAQKYKDLYIAYSLDICSTSGNECKENERILKSYDATTFLLLDDLLQHIYSTKEVADSSKGFIEILALDSLGVCRAGKYDIPAGDCLSLTKCFMGKLVNEDSLDTESSVEYLDLCLKQLND